MPKRMKLTQANVERLRPLDGKDAVTYWDLGMPGFGVRVSPLGRRTWIAQYRVKGAGRDGKDVEVRETFSTADKLPLDKARARARASFELASQGIHPVQAHKQKLVDEQAKQQQALTFKLLTDRYMAEYVSRNNKPSTAAEARRLLDRAIRYPYSPTRVFGELSVTEIKPADIDDLMAFYRPRGEGTRGLVEANSLLGALHRCFRWARRMRLIDSNPTLDMPMPLKNVPTRDRVLSDDEIVAFWHGCEQIGWPFGPLFRLLLLTGQRLDEVASMSWAEVGNLAERKWTIPATRTKNGRAHEVALSELAVEILTGLPRFVSDFVFPAMHGDAKDQSVSGFAYVKAKVAGYMAAPPWRLHDLRRTATTGMARLGVPPHIADKVLNHQSGTISGVAAVYNRFQYLDERRDALNAWGQFIERLVGANVVAMRAG